MSFVYLPVTLPAMMKRYIFLSVICFFACSKLKSSNQLNLYINYQHAQNIGGRMYAKDSIVVFNEDDVTLNFVKNPGDGYSADNFIQQDIARLNFIGMSVSDDKGVKIKFKSSEEFLKFMSMRSYAKSSQENLNSVMVYGFQRK